MKALLRRFWVPGKKKWVVGAGMLGMAVFTVASVELTSQSWFCNSCHIMNPYYASWKSGSHKNVACVECHIAPGVSNFVAAKLNGLGQVVDDVLSRTSTKPSASVSQLSCTRSGCHTVETLAQKETNNGRFKFVHAKHLGVEHLGVEMSCGTCHSHIKGKEHFEVSTNVCITCHLVTKDGESPSQAASREAGSIRLAVRADHSAAAMDPTNGVPPSPTGAEPEKPHASVSGEELTPPTTCLTCHDAPKGQFNYRGLTVDHAQFLGYGASCESCHRGVTATPPPIEDGRCLQCHNFGVERATSSEEMHRVHALGRHKVECFSCHGQVRHGPTVQTSSLEDFDCRKCHTNQHTVQRQTFFSASDSDLDAGGKAMSPMFLAHVDCTGCHTNARSLEANPESGALVAAASAQSCDNCHKPGLGEQMVPLWQKSTRSLYDDILANVTAAEAKGGKPLEEARHLLELVRKDGSWGVHNPKYTQKLLERARESLRAPPKAPVPAEGAR